MSVKTDIYKSALRDYDVIKSASEAVKSDMKNKIYNRNPRLNAIDKEINAVGIAAAKAIIKNPGDKENISFKLKERLYELNTEKNMIYSELGIDEEYFDNAYKCKKCKDTGFINGKECSCFRQYLIKKAYGKALLNGVSEYETFDKFNLDYYARDIKDKNGLTHYDNMRIVYISCFRFAENFGKEYSNLLLMGKTGLGKTFLCNSIARAVLDKGFTVIYLSAGRLFKTLQEEQFSNNDENELATFFDDVLTVDLLIIDDMGTEFPTILTGSQLFNILNERIVNKRPTVISTNMMPEGIKELYSDRVLSRLTDCFEFLRLIGEDIRMKKKLNK